MRKHKYSIILLLIVIFLMSHRIVLSQDKKTEVVIGKYKKIYSKILDEERTFLIYLPDDYDKSVQKYPVLYMLDGWEIFFISATGTVKFLSEFRTRIPKMILIAIPNTDRQRDTLPKKITLPDGRIIGGGADNFLKFITDELIPYIDQNYLTSPYKILYGASATGLFSIYAFLTKPESFNAYIASSPVLGFQDNFLLKRADAVLEKQEYLNNYLFLTYGEEEREGGSEYNQYIVSAIQEFTEILKNKAPKGLEWKLKVIEEDGHCPYETLYYGLWAIYSDWKIPENIAEKGIEAIKNYYTTLSTKYGSDIIIPEGILDDYGYKLLRKQKFAEAIEVYKLCISNHPKSFLAYRGLGEAYMKSDKNKLAIENYEKSLKLNPRKDESHKYYYNDVATKLKKLHEKNRESN